MIKVLVCGGRDYNQKIFVYDALDDFKEANGLDMIIHGAAKGADFLAHSWAKDRNIPEKAYPANWNKHGQAAGPIRNQQMLDEALPDYVIAFSGGSGTADMIKRAKKADIPVWQPDLDF